MMQLSRPKHRDKKVAQKKRFLWSSNEQTKKRNNEKKERKQSKYEHSMQID